MVKGVGFYLLVIYFFSSTYGNTPATRVCGESVFVDETVIIDGPFYEGCVLEFETKEGRNLDFTVLDGDIQIGEGNDPHSPLLQIQHQNINELSRKDLSTTFFVKDSKATVRFLKTITSNIQLKIQKAVSCPSNLGPNTLCQKTDDSSACYCLVSILDTQPRHTMFCLDYGMKLVSFESSAKELLIRSLFNTPEPFWSSLTDTRIDLKWVWESSMTLLTETVYTNWFPGKPNTMGGNVDDCMMYNGEFYEYWGDKDCSTLAFALCEKYG